MGGICGSGIIGGRAPRSKCKNHIFLLVFSDGTSLADIDVTNERPRYAAFCPGALSAACPFATRRPHGTPSIRCDPSSKSSSRNHRPCVIHVAGEPVRKSHPPVHQHRPPPASFLSPAEFARVAGHYERDCLSASKRVHRPRINHRRNRPPVRRRKDLFSQLD